MSWGRFSFNPHQGSSWTWRTRVFPAHKPAPRNVVVIDEDDDADVIIMDGAAARESASAAAAPRSQARKGSGSYGNVINIDDDEDEKDGTGGDKAGPSMYRASGSPAAMTPGRGSPRNIYGFDGTSDSSGSDLSEGWYSDTDDGSDCEILDDSAGTAREMWETAASRKKPPHGVHECKDAGATAFTSCAGLETQPGENSEHLFGAECHLDEDSEHLFGAECHLDEDTFAFFRAASKHDSQNSSCSTKKGPAHAQSSAGNAKGVQNNTGRSNDGSPPISVSTPEKVDEKVPEDIYSQKDQSPPEASSNTKQKDQSPPEVSSNTNIYSAQDNGPVRGKDLLQDPEELGRFASVIGDREKHKESVEYKRAAEEEWASRQRQLQIQAEEARKLRKRKKAEAQRLLDMEKRQKQRLEEVRESQRKNEEDIQLKEHYRGVVRKELEDLERRHWDMTSILHALGISVEGGEVRAFKQALLKFHPDRVSRNDIYQQVKAEETFKFISRLKEKLPQPRLT